MKYKVLDVRQTLTKSWFVLKGNEHWEVIVKRPGMIFTRTRFDVYRDKTLQYTLRQTSVWRQVLSDLLFFGFFYKNPFYFFKDGVCCGTWKVIREAVPYQWDFVFDGVTYRVSPDDRDAGYHVLKNGKRFADYQLLDRCTYEGDCSEEAENSPDLLILFATYAQCYLHHEMIWT